MLHSISWLKLLAAAIHTSKTTLIDGKSVHVRTVMSILSEGTTDTAFIHLHTCLPIHVHIHVQFSPENQEWCLKALQNLDAQVATSQVYCEDIRGRGIQGRGEQQCGQRLGRVGPRREAKLAVGPQSLSYFLTYLPTYWGCGTKKVEGHCSTTYWAHTTAESLNKVPLKRTIPFITVQRCRFCYTLFPYSDFNAVFSLLVLSLYYCEQQPSKHYINQF